MFLTPIIYTRRMPVVLLIVSSHTNSGCSVHSCHMRSRENGFWKGVLCFFIQELGCVLKLPCYELK